jgi:hypothetical protein
MLPICSVAHVTLLQSGGMRVDGGMEFCVEDPLRLFILTASHRSHQTLFQKIETQSTALVDPQNIILHSKCCLKYLGKLPATFITDCRKYLRLRRGVVIVPPLFLFS